MDILDGIAKPQLYRMSKYLLLFSLLSLFFISCRNNNSTPRSHDEIEVVIESESVIPLDQIMGKFDPAQHEDFVSIDSKYADRENMYLHKEAYSAFISMYEAAKRDTIQLIIRSATRNFYRQKQIWESKWTGKRLVEGGENLARTTPDSTTRALKILKWSSMPGTSRHHWGTDIDLNAFENAYFMSGEGKRIYDWLIQHAHEYGFCQPYTEKGSERPHGYNEERWHWSYLPLAREYIAAAANDLENNDINGFKGSGTAAKIDVKGKYILGVSNQCKHDTDQ